jgi:hypothetical protein
VATHSDSSEALAPDEPPTPAWLPVLGICLLVAGLILFLALQSGEPEEASAEGAGAPAAAPK